MPSTNVRDELPAYYDRVRVLREMAAAVIRNFPRVAVRHRPRRVVQQARVSTSPATSEPRRALPESPHRTVTSTHESAQDVRERLPRNRIRSRSS